MAFIRAFQMLLIISLMVSSLPFLYSSRTTNRLLAETKMAEEKTSTITKELENGSSVVIVEKRVVPTGPDPLHHNTNPTTP